MKEYQKRVIEEKAQLEEKHTKLILFTESLEFEHLNRSEQLLLMKQDIIMELYSEVLAERIASFA